MQVRRYRPGEEPELWEIFFNTIRKVCIKDYTQQQVSIWAPEGWDPERWRVRMEGINPFVCVEGEQIVGYSDLQPSGLIDHFFVHHEWQRRGVGSHLMEAIHLEAPRLGVTEMHSEVSITARPFYEAWGFNVEKEQENEGEGVKFINYLMKKSIGEPSA